MRINQSLPVLTLVWHLGLNHIHHTHRSMAHAGTHRMHLSHRSRPHHLMHRRAAKSIGRGLGHGQRPPYRPRLWTRRKRTHRCHRRLLGLLLLWWLRCLLRLLWCRGWWLRLRLLRLLLLLLQLRLLLLLLHRDRRPTWALTIRRGLLISR
jgi:hypothetical protein